MMKGENCSTWGWVVLIVGIIYLLQDLGSASWWPFSWYTALFVIMGLKWALAK